MEVLPDGQPVLEDVSMFERPRGASSKVALVCGDQLRDNVESRVVDVIACDEEALHPRHVSARHVQQTHARHAQTTLQRGDDTVEGQRRVASKVDFGTDTSQRQNHYSEIHALGCLDSTLILDNSNR